MTVYEGVDHRKAMGRVLRELREQFGVPMRELARSLGISHSHVSRIERGGTGASDELLTMLEKYYLLPANSLTNAKERLAEISRQDEVAFVELLLEFLPPFYAPELVESMDVKVNVGDDGNCSSYSVNWTGRSRGSRASARLDLLGDHELFDPTTNGNFRETPHVITLIADLGERGLIQQKETVSMSFRGSPPGHTRRLAFVVQSGQVVKKARFQVFFPSIAEENWTVSLYRLDQALEPGALDVALTVEELFNDYKALSCGIASPDWSIGTMMCTGDPCLLLETAGESCPLVLLSCPLEIEYEMVAANRVFGVQWVL